MLHVQSFTFNPFQENTYLVYNEKGECLIIDPGMYQALDNKVLFRFIDKNKLTPKMVINTHTHIDHVFGVKDCVERYQIPFGFHKLDLPIFESAVSAATLYGLQYTKAPAADFYIDESKEISLGDDQLQVFLTPGHSLGSVCFYSKEYHFVIAGDVLFQMSIGRSDLPGGNYDTLIHSIHSKLLSLPDETIVYAGHGPKTHIGLERMNNPFLQ
ncbi:MAG TPA: MBL fold metallo-hydrolase [Chitinophagaceae bacterium]|nr:MBL fold metallo-hydrolase [Chitinophagaceae bacterium]